MLSSRAGNEEKLGNLFAVVGFGLEGAKAGLAEDRAGLGAACRTAAGLTAFGGALVGCGTLGWGSLSGATGLLEDGVGLLAEGGCLDRGVRGAVGSSGTATAGSGLDGLACALGSLCRGVSGSSGRGSSLGLDGGCLDGCWVGSGCLAREGLRGSSLAGGGASSLTGDSLGLEVLGMPEGVGFLGSSICSLGLCCGAG